MKGDENNMKGAGEEPSKEGMKEADRKRKKTDKNEGNEPEEEMDEEGEVGKRRWVKWEGLGL